MTTVDTPRLSAEDVLSRGRAANEALLAALNRLPDAGDLPTQNERNRVWQRGQVIRTHRRNLSLELRRVTEASVKLEEKRPLFEKFGAARSDLEKDLQECEALPRSEQARVHRRMDSIRSSLVTIEHGPADGPEYIPTILWDRLVAQGIRPEPDQTGIFVGRGGLAFQRQTIAAIEKELADGTVQIESTLKEIAALRLLEH